MNVGRYHSPEPVEWPAGEQLDRVHDRGVDLVFALPLPGVSALPYAVDEGAGVEVSRGVDEANLLWWTAHVLTEALVRGQRRQELAEQGAEVKDQEHDASDHG